MKAIQKIEEFLGIRLEERQYGKDYNPNQKNTYKIRQEYIESLRLYNVVIDDFSKLLPYLKKLRYFEINHSTVRNFSDLLQLQYYHDLRLDNVVFENYRCDTIGILPWHLQFFNMKLDAMGLKCFKKTNIVGFKQVEFKNCHIDNIQALDSLEPVSLLIFDKITFTHKAQKASKKATRRLSIYNTSFENLSFLPFQDSLTNIDLENCQIGSMAELNQFPQLKKLAFDSDTTIEDKSVLENPSDKNIFCTITQGKKSLDLRIINPLKNYVDKLQLANYTEKGIDFIEGFKKIKHLSFYESKVYIDAFLPIAKQIESISLTNSTMENTEAFSEFTKLTNFQTKNYEENCEGLQTFKNLYPLKNQLKELDIYESEQTIKDSHLITEFTVLETLKIGYDVSMQTAEYILTLQNLKKLFLRIDTEEEDENKVQTLNLEHLKQLEFLSLDTGIANVVGFEHLQKLKSFKIEDTTTTETIDINSLPKIESLKRLNIESYDYEIKGLAQFPNLEALRIKGSPKIKLYRLENLKVLDLENSGIQDFAGFEELSKLEKLGLASFYEKVSLEDLYKFPNVKLLTLLESEVKNNDISHLAPLKKLQYLDLYDTGVSDVRVLNTLPNLKEVNIATRTDANLEAQLDKPEIAIYCGLPSICLIIWEEDEFGI